MPAVRPTPARAVPAHPGASAQVTAGGGLVLSPAAAPTRTALLLLAEPVVRELLALLFREAGFFAMAAGSLEQARRLAGQVRPDVVLLDLDTTGLQQPCTPCTWLQPDATGTQGGPACPPTVMLGVAATPCPDASACCEALLCIRKPFVPRELVAQVLAALQKLPDSPQTAPPAAATRGQRRSAASATGPEGKAAASATRPLQAGGLQLDAARHSLRVQRRGQPALDLNLAPVEIKLLACLMQHIGQVLTREEIVHGVWPADAGVDPRTVDQNVKRLRHTLQAAGAPALIRTVHGVGYRLLPVDGH